LRILDRRGKSIKAPVAASPPEIDCFKVVHARVRVSGREAPGHQTRQELEKTPHREMKTASRFLRRYVTGIDAKANFGWGGDRHA